MDVEKQDYGKVVRMEDTTDKDCTLADLNTYGFFW